MLTSAVGATGPGAGGEGGGGGVGDAGIGGGIADAGQPRRRHWEMTWYGEHEKAWLTFVRNTQPAYTQPLNILNTLRTL